MKTVNTSRAGLHRRMLLATAVAALIAGGATAQAAPGLVDLTIVDRETGQPLHVWGHKGRQFVAGQPGSRYSLRLTNRSGERVLVVTSVDGVNVITGETAGYSQRGYVIGPYGSHDVNGWRKSESEIAAFAFAPASRSYAARTDRPLDVGVVGIAVFEEYVPPPKPVAVSPPAVASRRAQADSARSVIEEVVVTGGRIESGASAQAAPQQERLGTAHGAREWSRLTLVNFKRASSQPAQVRRVEYDSYDNLVLAGVIPSRLPERGRPRPFPAQLGYVPDPPPAR